MYDPADMMGVFAVCVVLAAIVCPSHLFAPMRPSMSTEPAPEYSIYGDLALPTDFRAWIHVQLTDESVHNPFDFSIGMNYPHAYIAPAAYIHFLSTHVLPDGTMAFKRIVECSSIRSCGLADRSWRPRFIPSDIECANVAIKDRLQFTENRGWRFFRLNQTEVDDFWLEL
ncbi:cytochrome P460 family protein [Paraburkholderia phymatum]|uniref:cytochrome P460 family protein n=1 Tax=Paraburkholderia phymatum TaxID=148447 RepID=UPI003D1648FA